MAKLSLRPLFNIVHRVEEFLLAAGMMLIAVLTIANVFWRTVIGDSLASAEELNRFLIVLVCFVGLSYGASQGRHIRMTAFYDLLPLKPRKALMIIIAAVTGALMFFLAYWSVAYLYIIYDLGAMSPVLRVPLYIAYLSVPLGLVLAGIQYVLTVVRNLTDPDKVYMSFEHTDEYADEAAVTEAQPGEPEPEDTAKQHGHV